MRSDVTLYVVAAFFFALTITSAVIFTDAERSLWIVSTAVMGVLSVGLGYYQRPKTKSTIQKIQTTPVAPVPAEPIEQAAPVQEENVNEQVQVTEEPTPVENTQAIEEQVETAAPENEISTPSSPQEETSKEIAQTEARPTTVEQPAETPLTNVKGIGEKRAAQLNALGINTVKELAQASVEDLAKRLKVSPKIVAKWVEAAKQQ
jgi:predicted flap endonuclease-1-like 5' DNA nuclease